MWDYTTSITQPVIEEYKTVKGMPSYVDSEVMKLIKEGWYVYGLPQTITIDSKTILSQCVVKYKEDLCK